MVKRLARQPLYDHPGETWEYGLSTDVLGYFIEVVSGATLDVYLKENIFKPLKMKDTCFFPSDEKLKRLAVVYNPNGKGGMERTPDGPIDKSPLIYSPDYHYHGPKTFLSGGAGLVSTATDYARFLQMMLNGGQLDGVRLLSRKTVELMTSDSTGPDVMNTTYQQTNGDDFGLGFGLRTMAHKYKDMESIGTYMWAGFFFSYFWVDPQEEMFGIFMSQKHPWDSDLPKVYLNMVYQGIVD